MATISEKKIVLEMLRNDGFYPGDPQVYAVSSYRSRGATAYHVAILGERELREAETSPYVEDLTLLWKRYYGLTDAGRIFLDTEGRCADA